MRLRAINEEAQKLLSELGSVGALECVNLEITKAKRSKNFRLELYKTLVAQAVARRASRYSLMNTANPIAP
jgi:hypothetical protein